MAAKPTILVTNDDGIHSQGLVELVKTLVATGEYNVQVSAPDAETSTTSHCTTWLFPVFVRKARMDKTAFVVYGTPADCISLALSAGLFAKKPDLVISGIDTGSNCGHKIISSGLIGGAREALLHQVPAIALSYDWDAKKSSLLDFKLAAEECLHIIGAVLCDIKAGSFPKTCFLNINLPTDIVNYKGYKLTTLGKSTSEIGWKRVGREANAPNTSLNMGVGPSSGFQGHLIFQREDQGVKSTHEDLDLQLMKEGYITVTPIGVHSSTDMDSLTYFKDWFSEDGYGWHPAPRN